MGFEFSIGGYPGPFFHLELAGETLVCSRFADDKEAGDRIAIPVAGNQQWQTVLAFLSTRKWRGSYVQERVVDGTHWELQVQWGEMHIHCNGANRYPPGFQKFLRLLNNVTAEAGMFVY